MADFDKLWNYGDPAATEASFRALLPAMETASDADTHAQLLTQIARAQGLQGQFDEALATLNRASEMIREEMTLSRVRELLERGRVFNSRKEPAAAMLFFDAAWRLAEREGHARFAIDAVHMLAIAAADPKEQIEWNLRGIAMVEKDPTQKRWLPAFYNNIGESYAKAGEYGKALEAFEKLGDDPYALKDRSRMLRALGRPVEALGLVEPLVTARQEPNGWFSGEYAECLAAVGRTADAKPFAAEGYGLLKDDAWLKQNDPAMLDRLLRLSQ